MMADSERVVVSMPTFRGPDGKAERMLGMSSTLTDQQLAWLSQRGGPDAVAAAGRRGSIPTKALQVPPARDSLPPALSSLSRFPAPPFFLSADARRDDRRRPHRESPARHG